MAKFSPKMTPFWISIVLITVPGKNEIISEKSFIPLDQDQNT